MAWEFVPPAFQFLAWHLNFPHTKKWARRFRLHLILREGSFSPSDWLFLYKATGGTGRNNISSHGLSLPRGGKAERLHDTGRRTGWMKGVEGFRITALDFSTEFRNKSSWYHAVNCSLFLPNFPFPNSIFSAISMAYLSPSTFLSLWQPTPDLWSRTEIWFKRLWHFSYLSSPSPILICCSHLLCRDFREFSR